MNLKDVTPESLTEAILKAAEQGVRDVAASAEAAQNRVEAAIADARAAAAVVQAAASIDASTVLAQATVAFVKEITFANDNFRYGSDSQLVIDNVGFELCFSKGYGSRQWRMYEGNGPMPQIPVPYGRYRAILLLLPVELDVEKKP